MEPRMTADRSEPRGVDAVDRALSLLDCFEDGAPVLGLAELSRRSGLHKSTILRLAVSLGRRGFLVRQADGRFRLGPALWRLGARYRRTFDAADGIRPELHRLSRQMGETASFYVREGDRRVCLYREEPSRPIRHALSEGASLPLAGGASALVLRAFAPEGDPALDHVRAHGYATSFGARDPDVAAIAVPILCDGVLLGALTLSGLVTRFDAARMPTMVGALRDSAARLSALAQPFG